LSARVLVPLILSPRKSWVTGSQWSSLGFAALWFVTPVVLLWLTRRIVLWWERRKLARQCPDKW
jgi:hypothetical protein